jgi:outer membrane protein insertion porin family
MKNRIFKYSNLIIICLAVAILASCHWGRKLTYNVKDGQNLLVENTITADNDEDLEYEIASVVRQRPNQSKLRLRSYNRVDTTQVNKQQNKIRERWVRKTKHRVKKDHETDSTRIAKAEAKFAKDLPKIRKINAKRIAKADKVNKRRQKRLNKRNKRLLDKQAKFKDKRGHVILKRKRPHVYVPYEPELIDTFAKYKPKVRYIFKYKDTLNIRQGSKYRAKYKYGEAPVIADSAAMTKTLEQMQAFLKAKGYYQGKVEASFSFNKANGKPLKPKRIRAEYKITTGERFYIDTVVIESTNGGLTNIYLKKFLDRDDAGGLNGPIRAHLKEGQKILIPFDAFKLDAYRYEIASCMTEYKFYGFTEQNVYYRVDTARVRNSGPYRMKLTIGFSKRIVQDEHGNSKEVEFQEAMIKKVNFHISDTTYVENYFGNIKNIYGIDTLKKAKYKNYPTLNTYVYNEILKKVENKDDGDEDKKTYYKSVVNKSIFGGYKDSIGPDPFRVATFHYNGELFVNPGLLECQNYLEADNYFKQYYIERSYTRMQQLGLFSEIDLQVKETYPGSAVLDVDYYLVPSIRQSFSFQPKATHVNGFLGISGAINYSTNNMFRTGTKTSFSIESGFDQNSTIVQSDEKQPFFNTIEVAPTAKFDIPGWFPFLKVTQMGKRQRPRTEITTSYNYQKRVDFTRNLFQFAWMYNVSPGTGKNATFGLGFPLAAIKFVSIDKKPAFEERINQLNDQFLLNAYSNQLIWEDVRANFTYTTVNDDKVKKLAFSKKVVMNFNGTVAYVGGFAAAIAGKGAPVNEQGQKLLLGVPYSQFWIFDLKLIATYKVSKNFSIAYRLMGGYGRPRKNSPTSLPYDYSFSSGGANDVRGWEARQLGPGTYLSLLDPNAVKTQIGDVRGQSSIELRFGKGIFKQALFADVGNTWTVNYDSLRPGSQFIFSKFMNQLALGAGYGLRLDFDFFIFRLDLGIPIFNPTLPVGSQWIFDESTALRAKAKEIYGPEYETELYKYQLHPFKPHLHVGIGLPF